MNHHHLQIQAATAEDRDIAYKMICGLEDKVLDRPDFNSVFDRNLKNNNVRYFIAFYENVPVGIISCHIQSLLHHAALVSEIQEMYVESEFRSKGIGKALIARAIDFAKKAGAIQMEVTSRSTREQAHQFYQRAGFEKSHVKLVQYFRDQQ